MRPRRAPNSKGEYKCTNCEVWKPSTEFYKNRAATSGITSWCKTCTKSPTDEREALRKTAEDRRDEAKAVEADRQLYWAFVDMMERRDPGTVVPRMPSTLMTDDELAQFRT